MSCKHLIGEMLALEGYTCILCRKGIYGISDELNRRVRELEAKQTRAATALREACDVDGLRRAELIDEALEALR